MLTVLESVRCLECDAVYSKPADGGTVRENPGCPECGYVGWVMADRPRAEDAPPTRSVADHRRHRAY
jgi:ribosomal protein S27AE